MGILEERYLAVGQFINFKTGLELATMFICLTAGDLSCTLPHIRKLFPDYFMNFPVFPDKTSLITVFMETFP